MSNRLLRRSSRDLVWTALFKAMSIDGLLLDRTDIRGYMVSRSLNIDHYLYLCGGPTWQNKQGPELTRHTFAVYSVCLGMR